VNVIADLRRADRSRMRARSAAGWMLAVAAQLDLVARLLAVVAAVFTVGAARRDQALANWMRALHSRFSHNAPPRKHCTPIGCRAAIHLICAALAMLPAAGAAAAPDAQGDFTDTLTRVSRRIEQWYARAASIMSTENVWIQPLRADMTPLDFPRRLAFELRVEWEPGASGGTPIANVIREPLRINGRLPPANDPGCMDPKPVSPEPLAMLLPARLHEAEFTAAGTARVDGRAAILIDYRGVASLPEEITWTDDCVSLTLPGRSRGRIWVDAESYDVLRVDDRLVGTFSFDVPRQQVRRGAARSMVIERADSSIRYRRVTFSDPEETLLVPASIESVTVIRGAGTQRTRITQRFSDYRRFLTAGRIVD
jgi:hypothetical protein